LITPPLVQMILQNQHIFLIWFLLLWVISACTITANKKMVAYGESPQAQGTVWLCQPHNKQAATPANGSMLGLAAKTRAQVDAFHATALAQGGSCEGAPGLRDAYGPNMYMAYIRDPEGNKFSALCKAAT
jgi:catechol 2,3-dioxygenase-like lactoylglutathione lyase family enzyme